MAIVQDAIEGMPAVNIDDQEGARAAMQHVLAHGHREILILAIRSGKYGRYEQYAGTLRDRMQGYREALNAHGLDVDGRQVRLMECSSTEKGGRQVFRKVLKSGWRPSAVVAMSDIIAIGVMREALEAGIMHLLPLVWNDLRRFVDQLTDHRTPDRFYPPLALTQQDRIVVVN